MFSAMTSYRKLVVVVRAGVDDGGCDCGSRAYVVVLGGLAVFVVIVVVLVVMLVAAALTVFPLLLFLLFPILLCLQRRSLIASFMSVNVRQNSTGFNNDLSDTSNKAHKVSAYTKGENFTFATNHKTLVKQNGVRQAHKVSIIAAVIFAKRISFIFCVSSWFKCRDVARSRLFNSFTVRNTFV